MRLALYTDCLEALDRPAALDVARAAGCTAVELGLGGQSNAPHADAARLLAEPAERRLLRAELDARGLAIAAVNCSAWPLHPVEGRAHEQLVRDGLALCEALEVPVAVTMSGCPGDGAGATTLNWAWHPWPADLVGLRERQWEQAIGFWSDTAAEARRRGVRLALELHPLHLVYNVPTLLRLRAAVGDELGANLDPSHLIWQGADPARAARALGSAVHHVHLKDTEIVAENVAVAGVLESRSFDEPAGRAWNFRTVGRGNGAAFWRAFLGALRAIGYDGHLAIENEDPYQDPVAGVYEAAAFVAPLIAEALGGRER